MNYLPLYTSLQYSCLNKSDLTQWLFSIYGWPRSRPLRKVQTFVTSSLTSWGHSQSQIMTTPNDNRPSYGLYFKVAIDLILFCNLRRLQYRNIFMYSCKTFLKYIAGSLLCSPTCRSTITIEVMMLVFYSVIIMVMVRFVARVKRNRRQNKQRILTPCRSAFTHA